MGVVAIVAVMYAKFGGTRHVWDTIPATIPDQIKHGLALQLIFGQAVTFIKISMLLFTKNLMGRGSDTIRYIIIVGLVYVVASNISFTLVMIFQCKWAQLPIRYIQMIRYGADAMRPISAQWTLSFTKQNCVNEGAHIIAASVINVVSDFLVVLIPIPVVIKLRM